MLNYQRDPEGITWDCNFKMEIDQRLEYHCQKCRKNRNSQSGTLELPVSALNKWSTIGYVVGGCSAIPDAGEGIGMHNLPAEALVYNEQTWFVATLNGSSSLLIGMFLEIHWNHHHCFSVTVCQLWLDIIWSFLVQSNVGAAGLAEYRPHVVSHRKPLAGNLKRPWQGAEGSPGIGKVVGFWAEKNWELHFTNVFCTNKADDFSKDQGALTHQETLKMPQRWDMGWFSSWRWQDHVLARN